MYKAKFYKTIDRGEIKRDIAKEGFDPLVISDKPGCVYEEHEHGEKKLLVFLSGSMDVTVGKKIYHCKPGDKLIIPNNTVHKAIVGDAGCTDFWSEK